MKKPRWEMTDKERGAEDNKTFMVTFLVAVPLHFIVISLCGAVAMWLLPYLLKPFGTIGSGIIVLALFAWLFGMGQLLISKIIKVVFDVD